MTSELTLEEKKKFLQKRDISRQTIVDFCAEHSINVPTYYVWKKEVEAANSVTKELVNEKAGGSVKEKYNNLKKLYIGLSEQNYELAKFLDK